jgi:hypothetical protein
MGGGGFGEKTLSANKIYQRFHSIVKGLTGNDWEISVLFV